MPTTRLLRYTLSGSTFILFGLLFFWLLGGSLPLKDLEIDILKIITLILSTPLLGIIVSTIVFECLVCVNCYRTYYYVPENIDIIKWILKEKSTTTKVEIELRKKVELKDIEDKAFSKKFYPFYQVKVRKHVMGRSLSFLERKWAVIWIHRNIIGGIAISFIANLVFWGINFYLDKYDLSNFGFDLYKIAVLIFILIYILLACSHIKYSIKVAADFEHKILMNAYDEDINANKQSNASRKHQSNSILDLILSIFKP
jgi:hypothetical protein